VFFFFQFFYFIWQEYVPVHDGVVAKAKWEAEQMELNASLQTEIAR